MNNKLFVFLVSDDEAFIAQHKEHLSREVDLNVHRSAEECRYGLASRRPDLILLDTGLPNDDGFKLHRELRDDFDLTDLYQVLICTADEIAREGFSADDLLIKPVDHLVFKHKVELLGKVFAERAAIRDQMAYAQNVAFTSMSAMGELGVVMQFLSKSFGCHNIQSVAALAIESLRQYELQGAIYVVWEGDGIAQTTEGAELPESQRRLIEQRRTLGRILEIDRNLVVNFDHVTVLVSKLPEDDLQRLGRIRDNIATLAEGVESRIAGLLLEHDNILKQQGIRYAAYEMRESVKNLTARQTADMTHSRELISQVIDEFEYAFLHTGIPPAIENELIGDLVELRRKITDIVGRPGEVHEKLGIVITALETIAGTVDAAG
jgi:CheY-like chemotaxis protein